MGVYLYGGASVSLLIASASVSGGVRLHELNFDIFYELR
jgi:hypothetical protein